MKVAYITNVTPAYRAGFFRRLLADPSVDVTVFCQAEVVGAPVELMAEEIEDKFVRVPARKLLGGRMIWQSLPFRRILRDYDVIISDGNPRHLGFALVSTLAALRRKRMIIWSTFHSRRNVAFTRFLRLTWWRMFREFLSYTEPDARLFAAHRLGRGARSTNNGLDQERIDAAKDLYTAEHLREFKRSLGLEARPVLISIGRALPGRFDLMPEVLSRLRNKGAEVSWILLGGGEGLDSLKQEFQTRGLSPLVLFPGPVHDEEQLAKWFGIADLFVYPEAVGLSLFHAFGYGLPAVVHDELDLQGPEMGAFEEGRTGFTFTRGDAGDMADKIVALLEDDEGRERMGRRALAIVRRDYNSRVMYERLVAALLNPKPAPSDG